jgi:hypothetical protein
LLGAEDVKARGTVAGTVSGPEDIGPIAERQVVAIELASGMRHTTKTNGTGAFSLLLPPGRYQLEVILCQGEAVVRAPSVITLGPGDLVDDADIILGGAGVAGEQARGDRPRRPLRA